MLHEKVLLIENDGYIDLNHNTNKTFINEMNTSFDNGDKLKIVEPLRLVAILQKYDIVNKNGRIYPKDVLIRQVEAYQKLIDANLSMGEAEHPDDLVINSGRVAHGIRKVWFEGQTLMGEVELILSPGFVKSGIISCEGDRIANIMRNGWRVGVSSRGVGSVEERNGVLIVQDDFELTCWDIVINPSTPGAYIFPNEVEKTPFLEQKTQTSEPLTEQALKKFLI